MVEKRLVCRWIAYAQKSYTDYLLAKQNVPTYFVDCLVKLDPASFQRWHEAVVNAAAVLKTNKELRNKIGTLEIQLDHFRDRKYEAKSNEVSAASLLAVQHQLATAQQACEQAQKQNANLLEAEAKAAQH